MAGIRAGVCNKLLQCQYIVAGSVWLHDEVVWRHWYYEHRLQELHVLVRASLASVARLCARLVDLSRVLLQMNWSAAVLRQGGEVASFAVMGGHSATRRQ